MKPIKLGILGARRGLAFARGSVKGKSSDLELACICDFSDEKIKNAAKKFDVDFYTKFDDMLKTDIDAVVLANYFHEHAFFALKAMKAGKHVISETLPAATMAEAVMLCDTVEETGMTYMFAENCPFTKIGMAMKTEFDAGIIGKPIYGEGEYFHPFNAEGFKGIAPSKDHWRNFIPSTYYSSHSISPLMFMTGAKPIRVNALSVANEKLLKNTDRKNDPLAIMLCTMNDGSIFKITGWGNAGGYSSWYKLVGEKGTIEAPRAYACGYFGNGCLTVSLNENETDDSKRKISSYKPEWPKGAEEAKNASHGGADYFINQNFIDAIKSGKHPKYFDVYDGAAMSAVAILGWRSALSNGIPFDIPDFHDKAVRENFRNDYSTPFPNDKGWPLIPTTIKK